MKTHSEKTFLTILISVVFLSASVFAQSDYGQGDDPPGRVARLGFISGGVSFQPSGEDQWNQALSNYPLTTGDRIYTDRDGRAELETGNIAVRLSSDTDVSTTNLNDQLVQLGLAQGTLRVRAYDILSGSSVEIDTPNAALTLLRPGSYRVETYPDDNTTLVTVNSGDLEVSGNGLSQVVHSGQSVKLSGIDEVRLDWLSAPGDDEFDRWCGDRDRHFLSSNSRQYVSSYVPGYSDLDEYGRWEPAPEYGQVWYPSAVPVGWAPYRFGRWAWVEPWGWTWVEEEPWGFAPFHYGRWALIGTRWGWVPGTVVVGVRPIYAPALVAFVGGPNANVQVWFPLGPRDPFFPWYHHSDVYLRQVNVTNVRVNIVNVINVRNVNNIHYAYQRVAPTAVSTEAFRGSRPVAREIVRVDAEQIGRARVIPHPEIHPDVQAVHAGTPQAHPPVEQTRPRIESRAPLVVPNRNGTPQGNGRVGVQDRGRVGDVAHNPPPSGQNPPAGDTRREFPGRENTPPPPANNRDENAGRNTAGGPPPNSNVPPPGNNRDENRGRNSAGGPPPNTNIAPPGNNRNDNGGRGAISGPPPERRPLVTRMPPPPQNPPFAQRQAPLQEHPGRPLEPQQVDNIRRGQPAGQMHDREFPPHRDATPAPSKSSNPPRSEDRGKGRPHN
ncbi:MAG: DUF6600 domain-containing protein [Candidatus Angelobacter sp.]